MNINSLSNQSFTGLWKEQDYGYNLNSDSDFPVTEINKTYYPFMDEAPEDIAHELWSNSGNWHDFPPESDEYENCQNVTCDVGTTLPFTTKDWIAYNNTVNPKVKDYIDDMLCSHGLEEYVKED